MIPGGRASPADFTTAVAASPVVCSASQEDPASTEDTVVSDSAVRRWMRSSVWVSASTRRAMLALWCHGSPDSEELVLPESVQAALSATAGARRAAVCSVKGGH